MESCKSKAVVFHCVCVISEQKAWQAYSNNIFQRKEGKLFEQMCVRWGVRVCVCGQE